MRQNKEGTAPAVLELAHVSYRTKVVITSIPTYHMLTHAMTCALACHGTAYHAHSPIRLPFPPKEGHPPNKGSAPSTPSAPTEQPRAPPSATFGGVSPAAGPHVTWVPLTAKTAAFTVGVSRGLLANVCAWL